MTLSPLLGSVGLHSCHCPSQSRVCLPVSRAPVLQEHHGAFCEQTCGTWYKPPGPLPDTLVHRRFWDGLQQR